MSAPDRLLRADTNLPQQSRNENCFFGATANSSGPLALLLGPREVGHLKGERIMRVVTKVVFAERGGASTISRGVSPRATASSSDQMRR